MKPLQAGFVTDAADGNGVWQRIVSDPVELERLRSLREDSQWRPGAMRPEERERLVRIGLFIVLGDRAGQLTVSRTRNDSVFVTDLRGHGFGFPSDEVLGDVPQAVLEHDLEGLIDELCEMFVAWAERLPVCPLHPGVHTLAITVTHERVIARCLVNGVDIRTSSY